MAIRPFRLSIIEYLNASPLNYGFLHGMGEGLFEMCVQVPSVCADQLRAGHVDAGLISSIEYLRIPNLRVVPRLCISSPRRVRSVLLISRKPPEQIRTLALDTSSRTSSVLVRLILRERYGVDPVVSELKPDLETMLQENDAALMIGDAAMRAPKAGLMVLDLAEEWYAWTGLPFVFALWTVHGQAPELPGQAGTASYFHQSLEWGRQHLEEIIEDAWPRVGWTRQELREYFTENIRYDLGEAERQSLSIFFEKAAHHGLAPAPREVQYLSLPNA
jgi:chorismate dehydratase